MPLSKDLPQLTLEEATLLVEALSMEEIGQANLFQSSLQHCASRFHQHTGSGTGSLSLPRIVDGKVQVTCFGCGLGSPRKGSTDPRKGFKTLGDYLMEVGPPGVAEQFWTDDKIRQVVDDLRSTSKTLQLGWARWKLERGMVSHGIESENQLPLGLPGRKRREFDLSDLLAKYETAFFEWPADPRHDSYVACVCKHRGWNESVLRQCIQDRLIAVGPSPYSPEDVSIVTACRGIFPPIPGVPVRVLKQRTLFCKQPTTWDPSSSPAIGDFTPLGISLQEAGLKFIVEGEPDAISARHIPQKAGIVSVCGKANYSKLIEAAPILGLEQANVVFILDLDHDKQGAMINPMNDLGPVMEAFQKFNPKGVFFWMPPPGHGKDLNDFLKLHGPEMPIQRFCARYHPEQNKNVLFQSLCQKIEKARPSLERAR